MNDPAMEYYVWKETRQIKTLLQKMDKETKLQAEIERLSKLYRASLELLTEQGRLLTRAAEALAGCTWQERDALIAELRKAAE